MSLRPVRPLRPLCSLLLPAVLLACGSAQAADRLGEALQDFVTARAHTLPGKVSVELGKYPDNARIAACTQWEVSLPAGAQLWGQVSLAARCAEGPRQALYVTARVRIEGEMLVATRAIGAGQAIEAGDVGLAAGELGSYPPDVLLQAQDAVGRVARTSIAPGRPVQARQLRVEAVIQAGQPVQLVMNSALFSVSNEGVAISSAGPGQTVRVRLASGRILSGIANAEGRVELRP